MKKRNQMITRVKSSVVTVFRCERYRDGWILAALLSLVLFLFTALVITTTYVSDVADDRFLAAYLAGHWTGTSEPQLPFIHPIYSNFISLLYRLMPWGNWYANVLVFLLYVSCVIIMRCIFAVTKQSGLPIWLAFLLNVAVWGLISYDQVWLSFTTTPGVMCAAAAVLMLCKSENQKVRVFHSILWVALMAVAILVRIATAGVGVCFSVAALFYRLLLTFLREDAALRKKALKRFAASIISIAVLAAGIYATQKMFENDPELVDYYEFRHACAAYYDYPHYVENLDEIIEENGVSWDLYYLISRWFFMDPAVDADLLNAMAGVEDAGQSGSLFVFHNSLGEALRSAGHTFLDPWDSASYSQFNSRACRMVVYPSILLFLAACILFFRKKKENWIEFLAACCTCAGAVVLCLYSSLLGRFPLRVVRIIALPCAVVCMILVLYMLKPELEENQFRTRWAYFLHGIPLWLTVLAAVVGVANGAYTVFDEGFRARKENCIEMNRAMDSISISNPSNIYFYGNSLCCYNEAYPDYDETLPVNLFYWGGCYVGLEPYDKQMEVNGIETLDAELFMQDHVYFLAKNDESHWEVSNLQRYLKDRFGAENCTLVETLADGQIAVYQFS